MLAKVTDAVVIVKLIFGDGETTLFTSNWSLRVELAIHRMVCSRIQPDDLFAAMFLVLTLDPKIHYYKFTISQPFAQVYNRHTN